MDEEKETQDRNQDGSSVDGSEEAKQSSQSQPKLSKEETLEKEVQKRVSDTLAKRGDKVKPLEDRVQDLESENLRLKGEKLQDTATKYGLTLDQVKEAGIDEPDKVEALAKLFGREGHKFEKEQEAISVAKPADKPSLKVDSGKTIGGGKLTAEMISKMSPDERWNRREEISQMPQGYTTLAIEK